MIQKIKAIVLRYIKYSDTSVIANLYTDLYGRQSYMIHGIGSKKGKGKLSMLQPLTLINVESYYKPSREIQQIKDIQLDHPYISIPLDISKSTVAIFISEVLYKTLKEEESNPELFDFISNSIQVFDLTESNPNFHIHFLVHLSKYLGFFPQNNYTEDSYFDLKSGYFSPIKPFHNHYFEKENSKILSQFIQYSQKQHQEIKLSSTQRIILLEKIIDYYHLHFEAMGEIKSLEVLKDIFH